MAARPPTLRIPDFHGPTGLTLSRSGIRERSFHSLWFRLEPLDGTMCTRTSRMRRSRAQVPGLQETRTTFGTFEAARASA